MYAPCNACVCTRSRFLRREEAKGKSGMVRGKDQVKGSMIHSIHGKFYPVVPVEDVSGLGTLASLQTPPVTFSRRSPQQQQQEKQQAQAAADAGDAVAPIVQMDRTLVEAQEDIRARKLPQHGSPADAHGARIGNGMLGASMHARTDGLSRQRSSLVDR